MSAFWQTEPYLQYHSRSPPLHSRRAFSPTENVGGSTVLGVHTRRGNTTTHTADPGEHCTDSGLPDFPVGAGPAGAFLHFGTIKPGELNFEKIFSGFFETDGWSGISWPLRSSSAREFARTRKNRNVPLGV
jgi:hypothetical protein